MVVSLDASSNFPGDINGDGAFVVSHDNVNNANNLLVLVALYTTNTFTSPSVDGVGNMSLAKKEESGHSRVGIWYLTGVPNGNQVIRANVSNNNGRVWVFSLNGVNQASPVRQGLSVGFAGDTTPDLAPTFLNGDMIIDAITSHNNPTRTLVVGAGQTELYNAETPANCRHGISSKTSAAVTWTVSDVSECGAYVAVTFARVALIPVFVAGPTVDGIDPSQAVGHANISSDAGFAITERGWVVDTVTAPTTADTKFTTAGTTGAYDTDFSSLVPGEHYYCRPFATNSEGTTYGEEVEIDMDELMGTNSVDTIFALQANGNGIVEIVEEGIVTERGFCWGIDPNPTTADDKIVVAGTDGAYTAVLSSLLEDTTYHMRSYALGAAIGTHYGTDVEFKTIRSFIPKAIVTIGSV